MDAVEQQFKNILVTWIHVFHEILVKGFIGPIPSRLMNQACLPDSFAFFTNCRITLDYTEVKCVIPRSMPQCNLTYSNYKYHNTFKGFVELHQMVLLHMSVVCILDQCLTRKLFAPVAFCHTLYLAILVRQIRHSSYMTYFLQEFHLIFHLSFQIHSSLKSRY